MGSQVLVSIAAHAAIALRAPGSSLRNDLRVYFRLRPDTSPSEDFQPLGPRRVSPRRDAKREYEVMVGLGRLELPTSPLSGVRSNHLSYRPSENILARPAAPPKTFPQRWPRLT